jgi:hypothetical protein
MVSVLVLTIVYVRKDGAASIAVYVRKNFQLKTLLSLSESLSRFLLVNK